ncbi:hypothetical protein CLOM_g5459 [Closterium sp. NIES-68]|nr:hypothetical protein CLOM_g5459 [Closterium sp. NIES-68]
MRATRGSSRLVVSLLTLLALVIVWFVFLSGLLSSSSSSSSRSSLAITPSPGTSNGPGNLEAARSSDEIPQAQRTALSSFAGGFANVPNFSSQAEFRKAGRWSPGTGLRGGSSLGSPSGSPLGEGIFPSGTLERGLQPLTAKNGVDHGAADLDEFDWSRASQSVPCDLSDALQWQPHLPAAVLRRALSYKGDMLRLDMFLYKVVVQRLPVTVAVVGGPVTFLSAGHRGPQPVLFNQGLYGTTGERSHSPAEGWLSSALDTLTRSFPPRHLKQWHLPGQSESGVVAEPYWLINLGLPRGSLATWASCDGATFLHSLPDDVDLVIAELALSDQGESNGQGPSSFLKAYDTLLQHLLHRWGFKAPQNPPPVHKGRTEGNGLGKAQSVAGAAVVLVNFFSFCRGNQACREQRTPPLHATASDPSLSYNSIGPFSFGLPPHHPAYPHWAPETVSEDNITVLAQYYSVPSLSTRDVFFTLVGQQAAGYRLQDIVTTGPSNLPISVDPDTLIASPPPAAAGNDANSGDYGGASRAVDSVDPIDPHALSGALPTAVQARTKYADIITALFHSALKGLRDRLTDLDSDNATLSLLPFLLRPPPPFFSRWLHSTAARAFLRPSLPHACFSFLPQAVAPPVLGLKGFGLLPVAQGHGRAGLVAGEDDSWVEFLVNTAVPLQQAPIQTTCSPSSSPRSPPSSRYPTSLTPTGRPYSASCSASRAAGAQALW